MSDLNALPRRWLREGKDDYLLAGAFVRPPPDELPVVLGQPPGPFVPPPLFPPPLLLPPPLEPLPPLPPPLEPCLDMTILLVGPGCVNAAQPRQTVCGTSLAPASGENGLDEALRDNRGGHSGWMRTAPVGQVRNTELAGEISNIVSVLVPEQAM